MMDHVISHVWTPHALAGATRAVVGIAQGHSATGSGLQPANLWLQACLSDFSTWVALMPIFLTRGIRVLTFSYLLIYVDNQQQYVLNAIKPHLWFLRKQYTRWCVAVNHLCTASVLTLHTSWIHWAVTLTSDIRLTLLVQTSLLADVWKDFCWWRRQLSSESKASICGRSF